MKVCCANLPWEVDDRWGIRSGCRFPNLMPKRNNSYLPFPFLLAYTASYLESKNINVLLIDGVAERCSEESFISRLEAFAPELLLIETSTTSIRYDIALLTRVKSRNPKLYIAICGSHVSAIPEEALQSSAINFILQGEPEITTYELAMALSNGQSISIIQGLAYKDSERKVVINPRRPMMQNIDALPFPKRTGLPMDKYNVPGFSSPVMFMYGSRGCPFVCNFCLWVQTIFDKGKYVPRSPRLIVDEIEYILREYPKTKSIFFDDDTFNIGRKRLLDFASEMKRRNIFIPWGMNARADHWDKELIVELKQTGLFTLRIGIESGDPEIMRRSKKGLDLEEAKRSLFLFHEAGLKNHLNFIIGLAGETWDSINNTIRFIKSVPVDSVQFTVAVPFPGTSYYDYLESNKLLISKDWDQYHAANVAVMGTDTMTSKEIEKAITYARRAVYFSPRFIIRRFGYIRNMSDCKAIIRKGLQLLK